MYWTDITTDRIERASMDGKSRTVLHSTGLSVARALTMDYDNQVLYWADDSYNRIERSNPDGSNRLVVTTVSSSYAPFAMTYYNGRLYWADTYSSYRRIFSTSVTSPSITSVTSRLSYGPQGIQVVDEQRQPRVTNLCEANSANCSHLCLLSAVNPRGYSCACPDGQVLAGDGKSCSLCASNEFICDNAVCIPSVWECDSMNDCGDNSDEDHCAGLKPLCFIFSHRVNVLLPLHATGCAFCHC